MAVITKHNNKNNSDITNVGEFLKNSPTFV